MLRGPEERRDRSLGGFRSVLKGVQEHFPKVSGSVMRGLRDGHERSPGAF